MPSYRQQQALRQKPKVGTIHHNFTVSNLHQKCKAGKQSPSRLLVSPFMRHCDFLT